MKLLCGGGAWAGDGGGVWGEACGEGFGDVCCDGWVGCEGEEDRG